jgi:hypothetical protein
LGDFPSGIFILRELGQPLVEIILPKERGIDMKTDGFVTLLVGHIPARPQFYQ